MSALGNSKGNSSFNFLIKGSGGSDGAASLKTQTDLQGNTTTEDGYSKLSNDQVASWLKRVQTKGYQMGGMPNSGELFIARENGTPEMVGSIGGHTAVANANTQIVSAVAAGVSQSNEAVVAAINSASSNVVTAIDNKDTSVNIGDREIAAANNRGQKQLGRNLMS